MNKIQLDKMVAYHRAIADPNRIRILFLLSQGELNGLTLAEKLGITPATITHHMAKLREVGLINERRDKNTIYYSLDHYLIRQNSTALLDFIFRNGLPFEKSEDSIVQEKNENENKEKENKNAKFRTSVLNNFYKEEVLETIPSQLKKKLIVLEYMAGKLEKHRKYSEKEINEFIKRYHPDFATIRREFIMHQFMYREKEIYEINPFEMWAKWEML